MRRPPPGPRRGQLGRPRGATSEGTTARILAAARVCFARTGYAATTNKQIADEAGITAATIYLYFASKTALYMATVRDAYAELVPRYREALAGTGSMRDGFRALLAESASIHEEDPTLAAFFSALPVEMRRHADLTQPTAEAGAEVVGLFMGLIDAGVRAGEIPKEAAANVLALFIACTMGFSLYAATIDSTQVSGIIDAFSALIDGKLFKAPALRRAPLPPPPDGHPRREAQDREHGPAAAGVDGGRRRAARRRA